MCRTTGKTRSHAKTMEHPGEESWSHANDGYCYKVSKSTWNAKASRKNWRPEIIKRLRWYSRDWRGTAKFSGHFGFPKGSNKFGPFPAPCTSHWKDVMVYEASMQKVFSIVAIGFFRCLNPQQFEKHGSPSRFALGLDHIYGLEPWIYKFMD